MTLFDEQITIKPNRYPWAKEFIDVMHEGFWTDKEFTFTSDLQDFRVKLTDDEREMTIRALSAIGQIEIAVKTFWAKLGDNFPNPQMSDLGYVLANIEVIHNNAYFRLLDVLGIHDIFEKNLKLDWIAGRVKYLKKYTHKYYKDSKKQYIYALILFTLFVENVSLFSQFYIVKSFGKRGLLTDTNKQIAYTAKEEMIHAMVGMKCVNTLREELPDLFDDDLKEKIKHETVEAFLSESKIIDWMIGDFRSDIVSPEIVKEFIKNRINESLIQIGYEKVFDVNQELLGKTTWFDEEVLSKAKTDFFNSRPIGYQKNAQSFSEDSLFD